MVRLALVSEPTGIGCTGPYHCHREIEIDYFLSGNGVYSIIDEQKPIRQGDIFVFTNNIIHRIAESTGAAEMKIMKAHFDPDILWNSGDRGAYREFLDYIYNASANHSGALIINGDSPYSSLIGTTLDRMYDEFTKKQFKYEDLLDVGLNSIIIYLLRSVGGISAGEGQRTLSSDNYRAVCYTIDHINTHLSEQLRIGGLAELVNMSENNYLLQFRRFTGTSPYNFILSRRISNAVKLLHDTALPITEIAYECGFNNTVSFNKAFKSIMGTTPSALREGRKDL